MNKQTKKAITTLRRHLDQRSDDEGVALLDKLHKAVWRETEVLYLSEEALHEYLRSIGEALTGLLRLGLSVKDVYGFICYRLAPRNEAPREAPCLEYLRALNDKIVKAEIAALDDGPAVSGTPTPSILD
jgi:hypothetical protein